MNSEYQKSWLKERAAKGLCRACPNPAVPGRTRCRQCLDISARYTARWRELHPEHAKKNHDIYKRNYILRTYGISREIYDALLRAQNGVCCICRNQSKNKDLAVDHDHRCCPGGKSCGECVRGLLCDRCNRGIGYFKENVIVMQQAIGYLSKGHVGRGSK